MREERMKILQMVEDGKISADEATKLLDAVGGARYDSSEWSADFEKRCNEFAQNMTDFAKEVHGKVSVAFADLQPKMKEVTKSVVSKTAEIADNISKSLNETIQEMESMSCDCGCNDEKCDCENGEEKADDQPKEN